MSSLALIETAEECGRLTDAEEWWAYLGQSKRIRILFLSGIPELKLGVMALAASSFATLPGGAQEAIEKAYAIEQKSLRRQVGRPI